MKMINEDTILQIGSLFANKKFTILDFLGKGSMGNVYKVEDNLLKIKYALKITKSETNEAIERFKNEIRVLKKLNHENIVKITDWGMHNDKLYFYMDFIDGCSLKDRLEQEKRFVPQKVCDILKPISEALHCAHKEKIFHRDIKPSNIMIANEDNSIFVVDFGISKLINRDGDITLYGGRVGTPLYIAPELEMMNTEETDHRVDIYSTGKMVYELLTGKNPHLLSFDELKTNFGEKLAFVIKKATEIDPLIRYNDIRLFYKDFEKAVSCIQDEDETLLPDTENHNNKHEPNNHQNLSDELDKTNTYKIKNQKIEIQNKQISFRRPHIYIFLMFTLLLLFSFYSYQYLQNIMGKLTVKTTPENATVIIENVYWYWDIKYQTPFTCRLPYGRYEYRAYLNGIILNEGELNFNKHNNEISIPLKKESFQ